MIYFEVSINLALNGGPYMNAVQKLVDYCEQSLDLKEARLGEEYFYQSLPLCIVDAVFSIGVRYESTRAVVVRYCDYFHLQRIRDRHADNLPNMEEQESLQEFIKKMDESGIEFFTNEVFKNKQRTSPRNGILKTEAVYRFAATLQKYGVNYFQDVPKVMDNFELEKEIKTIPGQGSGISLRYFFMLAGSNDFIKPDRMIQRFITHALGTAPEIEECQLLLRETSDVLKTKYPHMNPRLLDYQIWSFTRNLALK
jgi:hypothetical protein